MTANATQLPPGFRWEDELPEGQAIQLPAGYKWEDEISAQTPTPPGQPSIEPGLPSRRPGFTSAGQGVDGYVAPEMRPRPQTRAQAQPHMVHTRTPGPEPPAPEGPEGPDRPGAYGGFQDVLAGLSLGTASVYQGVGSALTGLHRLTRMLQSKVPVPLSLVVPGAGGLGLLPEALEPGQYISKFGDKAAEGVEISRQAQEFKPTGLRWWATNLAQQVPQFGVMIASAGAHGPVAGLMIIGGMEGGNVRTTVREALIKQGMSEEKAELRASLAGGAAGVVNAVLEKIPMGEFVTKDPATRSALIGMVRGIAAEGPTELVQELVAYAAERTAGVPADPKVSERLLTSLLIGAGMGGAFGGIRAAGARQGTRTERAEEITPKAQPPSPKEGAEGEAERQVRVRRDEEGGLEAEPGEVTALARPDIATTWGEKIPDERKKELLEKLKGIPVSSGIDAPTAWKEIDKRAAATLKAFAASPNRLIDEEIAWAKEVIDSQPAMPKPPAKAKAKKPRPKLPKLPKLSAEGQRLQAEIISYHNTEIGPVEDLSTVATGVVGGGQQYGVDIDFQFAGPFPAELTDHFPKTKTGKPQVPLKHRRVFKQNMPHRLGEETLGALGAEELIRRADVILEGKKGTTRRAVDKAEAFARDTRDTEMLFTIERYRHLTAGSDAPTEVVRAGELDVGDKYEFAGEQYKVTHKGEGYVTVEDGIQGDLPENAALAVDKGTLKKPAKAAPYAGPTDLFGKPTFDKITGQQRELGIEPGERVERAAGEVPVKESLVREVGKLTNDPAVQSEKDALLGLQLKYKDQARKFFNSPDNPMPEIQEAWNRATRGGPLFGMPEVTEGARLDRGRIAGRLEAPARPAAPISAGDIIRQLQRAFRVPIRGKATHKMPKMLGYYYHRELGIRLKDVRSLATAIHEIGHYIDWTLNNRMSLHPPKSLQPELLALGKALYGKTKPPGGYKSEGFADFIRQYVTTDEAQTKAPNLYRWLTETYLPAHPDVAKKIRQAKQMMDQFRQQGAENRVEAFINRKPIVGTIRERIRRLTLWLRVALPDDKAALQRGMREAGIKPGTLRPSEDPYQLAIAFADKAPAKAAQFVLKYTTNLAGESTGPGLREIVSPVRGQIKQFTRYAVAARALHLESRDKRSGIAIKDAQYVFDAHDSPLFRDVLQGVTDWNHRVLDYVIEAGALSAQAGDQIKKLNPVYVPFMRAFGKGEIRALGGIGKGLTRHGKAVHALKGSGRELIDPFESMIEQMQKLISIAQKTAIARALIKLEAGHPGLGRLIWKVPPPTQAMRVTAEQMKQDILKIAVERLGVDPADAMAAAMTDEWNEVLTVYSNAHAYYGKDNIISLVVDGNRNWYEVDPDLYDVLEGMEPYVLPRFLNLVLGKPTRAVRLGATGLNPAFALVRNFLRDAGTFTMLSKHAKLGPVSAATGVVKDIARTPAAEQFKALGGKMSSFILHDRTGRQHLRADMLATGIGRYTLHTLRHPVDAIREVFGVSEAGTRIGEFEPALKYAEKKWGKGSLDAAIYALNAAQDVTVNFTRHGKVSRVLNQMIPFFNAAVQGVDKVVRTFHERPIRMTLTCLATGTLGALLLWWRNKDKEWYKNLPDYERGNYLHVEVPDKDTIVRIPVPFELGHMFMSLPVAVVDAWYKQDPELVKEEFGEALDQMNPVAWPALIAPLVHVISNKDWADRPIVPENVRYKMAKDQSKPYTTALCRIIGRTVGYSPAKLEYLINSYSGGLYGRLSRTAERGAQVLVKGEKDIALHDMPVIGTLFLRDAYAPRRQIDQFYERRDLLARKKASGMITATENRQRLKVEQAANKLSPLWKALGETKRVADRQRIYEKIGRTISPHLK